MHEASIARLAYLRVAMIWRGCAGLMRVGALAVSLGVVSAPNDVHAQAGTQCSVTVDATQALALATVIVKSPCRRDTDEVAKVYYEDDVFVSHFDADGTAKASFVLTSPHNEVKVRIAEGAAQTRVLDVPEFKSVYRVTLAWQAPVHLKLIVVEPGSRLNQPGAISEDQRNLDLAHGLGRMDLVAAAPEADASGDETTSEQSYVVPAPDPTRKRIFSRYLEFKSRGSVAKPPFCGDGALASVPYTIVVIEDGQATTTSFQTGRAACGEAVERPVQRT